jgi:hypothetical protein
VPRARSWVILQRKQSRSSSSGRLTMDSVYKGKPLSAFTHTTATHAHTHTRTRQADLFARLSVHPNKLSLSQLVQLCDATLQAAAGFAAGSATDAFTWTVKAQAAGYNTSCITNGVFFAQHNSHISPQSSPTTSLAVRVLPCVFVRHGTKSVHV